MSCKNTYRIELPYACFGIETNDWGIVVDAPPIARWMIGKQVNLEIRRWINKKGGKIEEMKGENP